MADFEQPCPDVFHVPLMSERFCKEIIEEMEHFGQWSDGSHNDGRLETGYESVPTIDIHMRQIDWEDHWIHILRKYVWPLQIKIFDGYTDKVSALAPTQCDRKAVYVCLNSETQPLFRCFVEQYSAALGSLCEWLFLRGTENSRAQIINVSVLYEFQHN